MKLKDILNYSIIILVIFLVWLLIKAIKDGKIKLGFGRSSKNTSETGKAKKPQEREHSQLYNVSSAKVKSLVDLLNRRFKDKINGEHIYKLLRFNKKLIPQASSVYKAEFGVSLRVDICTISKTEHRVKCLDVYDTALDSSLNN